LEISNRSSARSATSPRGSKGQIVGLKLLDAEKLKTFESRFKGLRKPSEGEIGKAIEHPRVNRTLEYGTTTDGLQYIVLEYLDGPGLNSVIVAKSAKLEGRRVNLLRQAAEALQAVHDAGFIHRDVCPRNFVCTADLESLKLIDFGLSVPATPPFLQPGNRTGTANYLAPEIVRRRATDKRIDIYSYGATAFELCAGALPWAKGSGQAALAHDHEVDIRQGRPRINPRLAETINKCLNPNPEARPPSFEAVLKMISRVQTEDQPG
jgi:serine/threonine protein kinase